MITVVNKKTHTPTTTDNKNEIDFYVGRPSPLSNIYTHISTKQTKAEFICNSRYEAIELYKVYLNKKIKEKDKDVCNELNTIWALAKKGININLVCWCSPQNCHANIIKNIIESKL